MATVGGIEIHNPLSSFRSSFRPRLIFSKDVSRFQIPRPSAPSPFPQTTAKNRFTPRKPVTFKTDTSKSGWCFRCLKTGYFVRDCRGKVTSHRCGRSGRLKVVCRWTLPRSSVDGAVMGFIEKLVDFYKGKGKPSWVEYRCSDDLISAFDQCFAPFSDPISPTPKAIPSDPKREGEIIDDSFFIFPHQPAQPEHLDTMLLDPSVNGLENQNREEIHSCEAMEVNKEAGFQIVQPLRVVISDSEPQIEEIHSGSITSSSSMDRPLLLNLSPVRFRDFSDFEIYDDFMDYYSDEEENPVTPPSIEVFAPNNEEDIYNKANAIYVHMSQFKFIFYCCIQIVDGFARLAHAEARGSTELSPFKPETTKKKSGNNKRLQSLETPTNFKRSPNSCVDSRFIY